MPAPDPWPLRHLVLRTPRLELRPDDDEGLLELVEAAHRGVHSPEEAPFVSGWTDAPAADIGPNTLRYFWSRRAALTSERWEISFLVRHEGRVVGVQALGATDFAVTGQVDTGSWLGLAHQGRGLGTEMRAAVLLLAFDHLSAVSARSSAFTDNPASLAVSTALGYRYDGTTRVRRRGVVATELRVAVDAARLRRPGWGVRVAGLDACRGTLGAERALG